MTKECIGCSKSEPEVTFALIKETGKYKARCTTCTNLAQKQRRLDNLEDRRAKEQQYREENRERIRTQYFSKEYAHEQYLKNKDYILKRHKEYNDENAKEISKQKHQYYLDNKEHILKRSAEYFINHRDDYYARNSKRRALLKNAVPQWLSQDEQERINLLYKIARKVQTLTGVAMHVDHIYPLNGKTVCGLHCLSNLQILTATENMEKSNSFPDEKYLKDTSSQ